MFLKSLVNKYGKVSIIFFGLVILAGCSGDDDETECVSDWSKCADNKDLISNYDGMIDATTDCQIAAEKLAKYGDPEWDWSRFGKYYDGKDYVNTGKIIIVDNRVKFQNGFGAMKKSTVECSYDLKSEKVLNIDIK